MKRMTTTALLVVLASLGFVPSAQAQVFIPPTGFNQPGRPQLSPYLNLLRGGDPAANYFMGVVPEQQNRANFNATQNRLATLDTRIAAIASSTGTTGESLYEESPLPPTGHRTWFGSPNSPIGQPQPAVAPSLLRRVGPPLRQPMSGGR